MKILVGLGNPGAKYTETRHNAGFRVVDSLAKSMALSFRKTSPLIETAFGTIPQRDGQKDQDAEEVILGKPLTFMNRSGRAVAGVLKESGALVSDILVIHDELDLPLGRIQFKRGGRAAGNGGIQSIIENLGTPEFLRLRIGIGRPPEGMAGKDYVLLPFKKDEKQVFSEVVERGAKSLECFLLENLETTMNRFNVMP